MKNRTFLKGALILIIFNLIGKVIGAVYRIPLARIIGSVGMGEYQLVFPLYSLFLTISTSGIPVAISKLVAEYSSQNRFKEIKKLLKISFIVLFIITFLGASILVLGARFFAKLHGNELTYITYYAIAPAVIFVGMLSAFRGYFQGKLKMVPTAVSGLIEQVLKLVIGLFLAIKLSNFGVIYSVFGALLGISISEFFALLFLIICYIFDRLKSKKVIVYRDYESLSTTKVAKQFLQLVVPITPGGLIVPITTMVNSFITISSLMSVGYTNEISAMMLGLESGVVEPLIHMPVVIAISLSTVLLPSLSGLQANGNTEKVKQLICKTYQITLSLAVAAAVCYVIFGEQIISLLYGSSFTDAEVYLSVKILFLSSANIIFLSLVQITTSVLQGLGHTKYPVVVLIVASILKVALNAMLIRMPELNIMGTVIASVLCQLFIVLLNQHKVKKITGASPKNAIFYISIQAVMVCLFAFFSNRFLKIILNSSLSLVVAGTISLLIFCVSYYMFFIYKKKVTILSNNSVE